MLVAADPETKQSSPSTSWQAREDETELRIPGTFLAVPKSRSIFCTDKKKSTLFHCTVKFIRNPLKWYPLLCGLLPDDKDIFEQRVLRNTNGK